MFIRCFILPGVIFIIGLFPSRGHESVAPGREYADEYSAEIGERSLRNWFLIFEEETGYRVLYRDALVAGKRSRPVNAHTWEDRLLGMLRSHGLDGHIDHERKQIVVFRPLKVHDKEEASDRQIISQPLSISRDFLSGVVLDDRSGERLPFATILWMQPLDDGEWPNGYHEEKFSRSYGTLADEQGEFNLALAPGKPAAVQVSHVGYEKRIIQLAVEDLKYISQLPVRLTPVYFQGREILVTGSIFPVEVDTVYQTVIQAGMFSPAGETSSIRMLQMLPSVSTTSSLSEGLTIRGSRSDAHQIFLDGAVIYSHAHLFGLIDSFNPDAIRTSSFYYDVIPARYQATPGGMLDLVTRTGSLYRWNASAGWSSTALSAGLEGPLSRGKSSWLMSGRVSTLNHVDWLGTDRMIAWGLDIDRERSLLEEGIEMERKVETPGAWNVRFHDLHGKWFLEDKRGSIWMVSGYSGYNNTRQLTDRLILPDNGRQRQSLVTETFETGNQWGNMSLSTMHYRRLSSRLDLSARASLTQYASRFYKEDFSYQKPGGHTQTHLLRIHPFSQENRLTHSTVSADFKYGSASGSVGKIRFGSALHAYRSIYEEESIKRSDFSTSSQPLLAESYMESRVSPNIFFRKKSDLHNQNRADIYAGVRLQYFSDGDYFRASPRLQVHIYPGSFVSATAGYSRTYQYLHRLSFYNYTTGDTWITTLDTQKPTVSDHWSAGIYRSNRRSLYYQAEAYLKYMKYVRLHEINLQSSQAPLTGAPWFYDNRSHSRGVELLVRYNTGLIVFTQTYTLSLTELQNDRIHEGKWQYAYWDRRHQWNSLMEIPVLPAWDIHLNWIYSTGVPNRTDLLEVRQERLDSYGRLDVSTRYSISRGEHHMEVRAGVYNLLDTKNPWYRDWVLVQGEHTQQNRLTPVQADVFDLGRQISVSVRWHFRP